MIEFALALYVVFLLVAFGWRSWLQYRRSGDHGFRGFSGRIASLEWFAGLLFSASLAAFLAAPIVSLLGLQRCLDLPPWIPALGVAVALAGFLALLVAQLDMGASWRVGVDPSERTELVTGGCFAVVRNPIFSALGIFCLGYALMVPNALAAAGLVCGAVGLELQVRWVEEPFLLRTHGAAYGDYARRVGRFVPKLGRLARLRTP